MISGNDRKQCKHSNGCDEALNCWIGRKSVSFYPKDAAQEVRSEGAKQYPCGNEVGLWNCFVSEDEQPGRRADLRAEPRSCIPLEAAGALFRFHT